MALPIRSTPELKGKVAVEFIRNAEIAYKNRASVDFSKQFAIMKSILKKAKL